MLKKLVGALGALVVTSIACGGGSSPTAPGNTPPPTTAPAPVATPTPVPTPDPNCTAGLCEAPISNTNDVVRTQLKLYQLFDDDGGWILPTPDPKEGFFKESFNVGWTLRLDVTGRDKDGAQTQGKHNGEDIVWHFNDETLFRAATMSPWQKKLHLEKPGDLNVWVSFAGIGSNDLNFRIVTPTP